MDINLETASLLYNKSKEDITLEERRIARGINFPSLYTTSTLIKTGEQ